MNHSKRELQSVFIRKLYRYPTVAYFVLCLLCSFVLYLLHWGVWMRLAGSMYFFLFCLSKKVWYSLPFGQGEPVWGDASGERGNSSKEEALQRDLACLATSCLGMLFSSAPIHSESVWVIYFSYQYKLKSKFVVKGPSRRNGPLMSWAHISPLGAKMQSFESLQCARPVPCEWVGIGRYGRLKSFQKKCSWCWRAWQKCQNICKPGKVGCNTSKWFFSVNRNCWEFLLLGAGVGQHSPLNFLHACFILWRLLDLCIAS